MNVSQALDILTTQRNSFSETASLDAQVLLAHILQKPRAWVLSHSEGELTPAQKNELEVSATRLEHGEPLPYLLGHWEFFGLDFLVNPAVLIPRPETELLVERAIRWLQSHPASRRVADIGTGSGCIAISLATNLPNLEILATDISPQALEIAHRNAERHGSLGCVNFIQADLLALPGGLSAAKYDLIAANLPYIPNQTLQGLPVSRAEPALALDGGIDGLKLIQRLLQQAPARLAEPGCVLLEIEARQGTILEKLAQAAFPQAQVQVLPDLAGRPRLVEVNLPPLNRSGLLVHLCTRSAWNTAQQHGSYQAESLNTSGFIHLSRPDQILQVANAFYRGLPDPLLLWIDPARLHAELRWEMVENDSFPHLHGQINLDAVVSTSELSPDRDGIYRTVVD